MCSSDLGASGGHVEYYDKNLKDAEGRQGATAIVKLPFAFIVLDETSTIRGWSDHHEERIFSNEVKDTVADPFVVKVFSGPVIAEGFYRDIKDRVAAAGGRYTANVYLAYKDVDKLKIGSVQFHGAALGAWMDFRKEAGNELYSKAVKIVSYKEGKKGSIVFRTPVFSLIDVSKEADDAAGVLQQELAKYHAEYFSRAKQQVAAPESSSPEVRQTSAPPEHNRSHVDEEPVPHEAAHQASDDMPF